MALIKCRECSKDVSSEAPTCPHCGVLGPDPATSHQAIALENLRKTNAQAAGCLSTIFMLAISVFLMLIGLSMCGLAIR